MSLESLLASMKNGVTQVTQVQPTPSKGLPVTPRKLAEVTAKALTGLPCTPVTPVTPKREEVQVESEANQVPVDVWTALEAGGITKQDLPEWTPAACQDFLLMVKKLYLDNFTMRGGLGYHGINCPDEWPPEFSMAVQSIYARAMQCSGEDWELFLDMFDGVTPI